MYVEAVLSHQEQSGAVEACWAHNPEVRGSKPRSARTIFLGFDFLSFFTPIIITYFRYAVKLREVLTELGPCFVKLGQALSIRPDVLPSTFLDELQKLCDSMPSFPTPDAIAVIEKELG